MTDQVLAGALVLASVAPVSIVWLIGVLACGRD